MTRALAARALELLGPLDGSLAVVGHRPHRLAAALGLRVERLRLMSGERVQLVAARWGRDTASQGVELEVPATSK